MGAGASISEKSDIKAQNVVLKKLPEAIEEAIYVHEKFPLIIDPTEQAARFLKYQMGSFINSDDPTLSKQSLNRSLVGALQYGRTMTLKFDSLDAEGMKEKIFEDNIFPVDVLDRQRFYSDEIWQSVLKSSLGDPDPKEINISQVHCIYCHCGGIA